MTLTSKAAVAVIATVEQVPLPHARLRASKVLGWPNKMQVGPCIPVGVQLVGQLGVSLTSGAAMTVPSPVGT